jgi:transposase-like protein
MSHPALLSCLNTPYSSKCGQKGGTVLAGEVRSIEEHDKRLCDPDGYRPLRCPRCRYARMHAHGFRWRRLRSDPDRPFIGIRRYRCFACRSVWQVVPGFLARCLHRRWIVVRSVLVRKGVLRASGDEINVSVPGSTVRRWSLRLRADLQRLRVWLSGLNEPMRSLVTSLDMNSSCADLIEALAGARAVPVEAKLGHAACLIHVASPGVRIM